MICISRAMRRWDGVCVERFIDAVIEWVRILRLLVLRYLAPFSPVMLSCRYVWLAIAIVRFWRCLVLVSICQTLLTGVSNRGGLELCVSSVGLGYLLTVYLYRLRLLIDSNILLPQLLFLVPDLEFQGEQHALELAYFIVFVSYLFFHMCGCARSFGHDIIKLILY